MPLSLHMNGICIWCMLNDTNCMLAKNEMCSVHSWYLSLMLIPFPPYKIGNTLLSENFQQILVAASELNKMLLLLLLVHAHPESYATPGVQHATETANIHRCSWCFVTYIVECSFITIQCSQELLRWHMTDARIGTTNEPYHRLLNFSHLFAWLNVCACAQAVAVTILHLLIAML